MTRDYSAIKPVSLLEGSGYAQPTQVVLERVRINSPAVDVMTDLTRVTAAIILPGDAIDEAHRRMIQRGVRLLLVVDQDRRVHGIVTANDVLGEKPVKTAVQRGVPRSEIQVRDIMTPRGRLEVLDLRDVQAAACARCFSRDADCPPTGHCHHYGSYGTHVCRHRGEPRALRAFSPFLPGMLTPARGSIYTPFTD